MDAPSTRTRRLAALAIAAPVCAQLTLAGVQSAEGPGLLAAFKVWQKTEAPQSEWSDALEQYRTTLVREGRSTTFGVSRWDLIAFVYTIEKRSIQKARDALRPGGLVVVEAGVNSGPAAAFGYAPGELLKLFDGFEILKHKQVEGTYDWGPERIQLVRFLTRKPQQ